MLTQRELHNLGNMIEDHGFKADDKLMRLAIDIYKHGKNRAKRSSIGYGVLIERKRNKILKDNRV